VLGCAPQSEEATLRRSIAILALALAASGCAKPRVVTDITISGEQVKMIYARAMSTETGIIQCLRGPDGNLTDCKKVPVKFLKKGSGGGR
jgi:hypothetical protein